MEICRIGEQAGLADSSVRRWGGNVMDSTSPRDRIPYNNRKSSIITARWHRTSSFAGEPGERSEQGFK